MDIFINELLAENVIYHKKNDIYRTCYCTCKYNFEIFIYNNHLFLDSVNNMSFDPKVYKYIVLRKIHTYDKIFETIDKSLVSFDIFNNILLEFKNFKISIAYMSASNNFIITTEPYTKQLFNGKMDVFIEYCKKNFPEFCINNDIKIAIKD